MLVSASNSSLICSRRRAGALAIRSRGVRSEPQLRAFVDKAIKKLVRALVQDCQRGWAFRGTVGVNEPIPRSSLDKRLTGFIEKLRQYGILGRARGLSEVGVDAGCSRLTPWV